MIEKGEKMLSKRKLKFWLDHDLNVLVSGRHGVGKSTVIKQVMNEEGLKWKYFSTSTMDPWVDFIGVPKEKEVDGSSHLELVRPPGFADDQVEAIVMDEFNRSHPKVRNAVMELIQFKSINGHRFDNLRVVWAIINPDDDASISYDVQPLDGAQRDRFQIHVEVPYGVDRAYFADKYGALTAAAATEWWENLDEDLQLRVSPRRLDYALEVKELGGSVRDVLPVESNPRALSDGLNMGSIDIRLDTLHQEGTEEEIREFFEVENHYRSAIERVLDHPPYREAFVPLMPAEKIAALVADDATVRGRVKDWQRSHDTVAAVVDDMVEVRASDPSILVELSEYRRARRIPDRCLFQDKRLSIVEADGEPLWQAGDFGDGDLDESYAKLKTRMQSRRHSTTRQRKELTRELLAHASQPEALSDRELIKVFETIDVFLERSIPRTSYRFDEKHDLTGFVNALLVELTRRDMDPALLLRKSFEHGLNKNHGLVELLTVTEEARIDQ